MKMNYFNIQYLHWVSVWSCMKVLSHNPLRSPLVSYRRAELSHAGTGVSAWAWSEPGLSPSHDPSYAPSTRWTTPASSDAPDHWGCPGSTGQRSTATPKATYIIGNHFNSKWTLNFTACVNYILTSYPVMAIRCMESFTAFRMPRIDESASCRSSSPSQPLLFFSSSWQKHTWTQRLHQWEVQTWGTYLDIYSGSSLPSVRAGIWLFSALVWAGTSPNQAYVPVSFDTPENNTRKFSLYFFTMIFFLIMTMMIIIM